MRTLKWLGLLGLGIALGAFAGAAFWYAPSAPVPTPAAPTLETTPLTAAPAPVVDAPAPEFALRDLEGQTVNLTDLRGTAVILNFWTTWCVPCREELPLLDRIAQDYPGALTVISVDAGEQDSDVRSYVEMLDLAAVRVLLDPTGQVRDLYLVRGYPTTFFIDSAGIIQRIKLGTLESSEIEAILKKMGANS
jgi:cytochrome c biogenesis protein CcmG/thiol:disulfide interchange protein DsbE